jgi:elongator complex protein 3
VSSELADGETTEESVAFQQACEELVDRIIDGEIERDDLESAKLDVCATYSSPKVPKNTELLSYAPQEHRDTVKTVVKRKPVRTASGVSPVAIMTSPHMCPHGKCLYCPGGPAGRPRRAERLRPLRTGHAATPPTANDRPPGRQG